MSSPLTNQTPAASYGDLLRVSNGGTGITANLLPITDGLGTDTALEVSTTGVKAVSGLYIGADRILVGGGGMVATSFSPMSTNGSNITFESPGSGTANGDLRNVTIGEHGIRFYDHGKISTSFTMNHESGNVQSVELNNPTVTATFTDLGMVMDRYASSKVSYKVRLHAVQDSTGNRLISWPSELKWPGGTAPTLTSATGKVDIFEFETLDYGQTWYGNTIGLNY
jgi:hypothetical protein